MIELCLPCPFSHLCLHEIGTFNTIIEPKEVCEQLMTHPNNRPLARKIQVALRSNWGLVLIRAIFSLGETTEELVAKQNFDRNMNLLL